MSKARSGDGLPMCVSCGITFESYEERMVHLCEIHKNNTAVEGLTPGEFPKAAHESDSIHELSERLGWTYRRACIYLGAYGLSDQFVGGLPDD